MPAASLERSPEAGLAALGELLIALRCRGLFVGVDDSMRVAVVFQHAQGWSKERRIRALKAILGRTQEERLLIDQLAPLLFVDPVDASAENRGDAQGAVSQASLENEPRATTADKVASQPGGPSKLIHLHYGLFTVGILLGVLLLADAGYQASRFFRREPVVTKPTEMPTAPSPAPFRDKDRITVRDPLQPLYVGTSLGLLLAVLGAAVAFRYRQVRQRIAILASSAGPRIFKVSIDEKRTPEPIDRAAMREAAFQLCAPVVVAEAPWIDAAATVERSARMVGMLLNPVQARWKEHVPILLIEDISLPMQRWPFHGRQMAQALARQGCELVHRYMRGEPDQLSAERAGDKWQPLEQELARLTDCSIVIVSDASALDARQWSRRPDWLGRLRDTIWLHPRPPELWDTGARWLASQLQVIPMSPQELTRLGREKGITSHLQSRWHPPLPIDTSVEQLLLVWRTSLGEAAFAAFAAGAILDKAWAWDTRVFWTLIAEGILSAPWAQIEKIWELPYVTLSPGGGISVPHAAMAALEDLMQTEYAALAARVGEWLRKRIGPITHSEDGSLADLFAGVAAARVARSARLAKPGELDIIEELEGVGLGPMLAPQLSPSERKAWHIRPGSPLLSRTDSKPACLLIFGEQWWPQRVELRQSRIRIGRGGENDIILNHPYFHARHITLTREGGTHRLVSESGAPPVTVNGQPVTVISLEDGMKIGVGPVNMQYLLPLSNLSSQLSSIKRPKIRPISGIIASLSLLLALCGIAVWLALIDRLTGTKEGAIDNSATLRKAVQDAWIAEDWDKVTQLITQLLGAGNSLSQDDRAIAMQQQEQVIRAKQLSSMVGVLPEELRSARDAYLKGNYEVAIRSAQMNLQYQPAKAWILIGASACHTRDSILLAQSMKHLSSEQKLGVRTICNDLGFLP